jgi:hypothetical protein
MLKWSEDTCKDVQQQQQQQGIENSEAVIEALCPHTGLKRLRVENYPGRRFPPCFENLPSLESLEIVSCPRLTQFSVRMMRSLRNLRIRQCADLAVLPGGLCGLESLRCLETVCAPNLRIGAVDILPRNVSRLAVSGCVALERWCLEEGAERVQQIPDVRMRLKN